MGAAGDLMIQTASNDLTHPSFGNGKQRRPPSPYPSLKGVHFDHVDNNHPGCESIKGCIGLSFSNIMSILRIPTSRPTSPLSLNEDNTFGFFQKKFSTLIQKSPKPLHYDDSKRSPRRPNSIETGADASYFSDSCTYDDPYHYDVLNRVFSSKSLGTELTDYRSKDEASRTSKHVKFQYPPITSVRLRPRIMSDEIDQLFFVPDELDQIEDDRSCTKAADDVETVVVALSEDWSSIPTATSSSTSSIICESPSDEIDLNDLSYIREANTDSRVVSPKSRVLKKKTSNRLVHGVRILLREKSLK